MVLDCKVKILRHGFSFNVGDEHLLEILDYQDDPSLLSTINLEVQLGEERIKIRYEFFATVSVSSESTIVDGTVYSVEIL